MRHRHIGARAIIGETAVVAGLFLAMLPAALQAQGTVEACYVDKTGVLYVIGQPGLPAECVKPDKHVRVSWTYGTAGDHGELTGLGDDDHAQYLLADGSRALGGSLAAGGHTITGLGAASGAGEAVRYEQAVKTGDVASGDLGGTYPAPTVGALQGHAVAATAPSDGQVLAWNESNTSWEPASPDSGPPTTEPQPALLTGFTLVNASAWGQYNVTATATCPSGKKPITGGFSTTMATPYAISSRPTSDGWTATMYNGSGFDKTIYAYALCVDFAP